MGATCEGLSRALRAAALAFAFAAFALALAPGTASAREITGERGGTLIAYAIRAAELRESGETLRIEGRCDSACTLYLSLANLCILPGASFGFHLPDGYSQQATRTAARYLMRNYPAWVRAWLAGRGGLREEVTRMPYSVARRHLPECLPRGLPSVVTTRE